MDPTAGIESCEARSEEVAASVGEKRPAEVSGDDGLVVPSPKKARAGGGLVGNVKKVAEIVLVLAAMGKMRAGRSPTAVEKAMMEEARGKLAEVCEAFAPKDIFPRDAFGGVIEDLGLNKLREQRLGFRPPKMSIAEKLLLTKRKMEKSHEFSLHSAVYMSQRLQKNSGAATESRGSSPTVRTNLSDKPTHAPNSSGGLQPASPLGHVPAANSTSLPYQLPASDVRSSTVSTGLPSSYKGKDPSPMPLPRVERVHFRLDGRTNGSSLTSQVQANSSGDHAPMRTPTWSIQPQFATSAKVGQDSKVPAHPSIKDEGTADISASRVATQATTSKPFIAQTTSVNVPSIHQHMHGVSFVQPPPLFNSHSEIGKIVQKLLQPHLPQPPSWIPPSREYMNKTLACQMCKLAINEVETVLVCDACERGFHLKCLQSQIQKGIPRGEWHCQKCLTLSHGKPLPPKYGRVTRNINAPKVSTEAPVQSSPNKKAGTSDDKFNQQKITVNGSSDLQSAPSGTVGNSSIHSTSNSNTLNAKERQGNNLSSSIGKIDVKLSSVNCPNNVVMTSEAGSDSAAASSLEGANDKKLVSDSKAQPPSKLSGTVLKTLYHPADSDNPQDNNQAEPQTTAEISSGQRNDNNHMGAPENGSSSDGLFGVDWIGDVLQVVDEKKYYQSCSINETVYKVNDHALFRSNNDKLIPSKIQAMWEDSRTRSKWVIVNRCYFPDDLPDVVGRPCAPERNEVYESNHVSTVMAGLIRGQCEVLPPGKFIEENERRTRLGTRANDGSKPLFICKWFHDESKGLFRDVSS